MMDGGRSQRRDNHRRSQNKKPPRDGFRKMGSVGWWEKEFCKVVGSMEWDVFLRKKKNIHLHPRAIEWNDVAGEEAFKNAKRRFWSQKYELPCDIPLPDPDLYINHIDWDWDSKMDTDICVDVDDRIHDEGPEYIGDPLLPETYQGIVPTGWADDAPAATFTASYGDIFGSD